MKILCVGDVVGRPGTDFLCRRLPGLRRRLGADVCIVNGENAHPDGVGITRAIAEELFAHGADVITTGNHALRRAQESLYEETEGLICPANLPHLDPRAGRATLDLGRYAVTVINLSGVAFLEPIDNPFDLADRLLAEDTSRFKVVDFHAESTAEKQALGWYLDGRVSAVFGTHTHVPTADARVLPGGTGYLTDVGMTGPVNSVIGVKPELAIRRQRSHRPVRFAVAEGPCRLDAVLFTCDDATGRCLSAQPVRETEEPQGKAHA